MKWIRSALLLSIVLSSGITASGRGLTAPPPRFIGIGNAGDWLGNGPILGFETPYGDDFPGNGGGTSGFEWDPIGSTPTGGGAGSPPSGTCGECRCLSVNLRKYRNGNANFCDNYCMCVALSRKDFEYGPYIGSCKKYGSALPNGQGGGCCHPEQSICYP